MRILLCTLLIVLSSSALADFDCPGKIGYLGMGDTLAINNGNGIHVVCTIEGSDKCKAWLSMALAAKMTDKQIRLYYRDNTGKTTNDCPNIGHWITPGIYWMTVD